MPVMDEFKEERAQLKNAPFKEKLNYFIYYYKWYVIGIICAVAFIGSLIYSYATKKEMYFNAVMMNVSSMHPLDVENPYLLDFIEYAGVDTKEYDVYFDTSFRIDEELRDENAYTSVQKLAVYTAAGDLDAMVTDIDSFRQYANSSTFHDLRNILTPEQLEQYKLYYVDWKVVEAIEAANERFDDSFVPTYPDPTKPEEMEQPIPVGIYLDDCQKLQENYYFRGEEGAAEHVVMGVYVNTGRVDNVMKFLEFVTKE